MTTITCDDYAERCDEFDGNVAHWEAVILEARNHIDRINRARRVYVDTYVCAQTQAAGLIPRPRRAR